MRATPARTDRAASGLQLRAAAFVTAFGSPFLLDRLSRPEHEPDHPDSRDLQDEHQKDVGDGLDHEGGSLADERVWFA